MCVLVCVWLCVRSCVVSFNFLTFNLSQESEIDEEKVWGNYFVRFSRGMMCVCVCVYTIVLINSYVLTMHYHRKSLLPRPKIET